MLQPGENPPGRPREAIAIEVATEADREAIYRIRHDVYAREIGQHPTNAEHRLRDSLDAHNHYLVARRHGELLGFVSLTPPGGAYSIDKYLERGQLPFPVDEGLFEVRLLTVIPEARAQPVAAALMFAAFRWVESHGGSRIVAIGRREVLAIYRKGGLRDLGREFRSGAVNYVLMSARISEIRASLRGAQSTLCKLERRLNWRLPFPFDLPEACFHGGASFEELGDEFTDLSAREGLINADVLDAWFPPSPRVIAALQEHLPWLLQTSPPTHCEGMIRVISRRRDVPVECLLVGGGSSDLIYLALREWLSPQCRVLILNPTYGEYEHVLERVIGCKVDRLTLSREAGYELDPEALVAAMEQSYDLVILVNPNSPTGRHLPREALQPILEAAPASTLFWIDETYVDYAGSNESLERLAAQRSNVMICKSMSKAYALSGARAAYLCGPPSRIADLKRISPPWAVGLIAQAAAVEALNDPEYYAARYAETAQLREGLRRDLLEMGLEVVPGAANFLLFHLPQGGPSAAQVRDECQRSGLFLRLIDNCGASPPALRIAVKDAGTNRRMIEKLASALLRGH